jgi:antitoxin component YwqK of YwqJK toxin-antitoxin module
MEDSKKKISEILKNLTSQKNIELYKRFLKFLNPLYLLKVWKDNSISVINKVKTSIPILLLIWILIPGQTTINYNEEEKLFDTKKVDGVRKLHYKGEIYSGKVEYYYKGTEQLRQINEFEDGDLDGNRKRYYEDGQLREENNYKIGEKDGNQKDYFEDGKLKFNLNYKMGKQDGRNRGYYENGELKFDNNKEFGLKDGSQKKYYDTGQLNYDSNYEMGKKDGS